MTLRFRSLQIKIKASTFSSLHRPIKQESKLLLLLSIMNRTLRPYPFPTLRTSGFLGSGTYRPLPFFPLHLAPHINIQKILLILVFDFLVLECSLRSSSPNFPLLCYKFRLGYFILIGRLRSKLLCFCISKSVKCGWVIEEFIKRWVETIVLGCHFGMRLFYRKRLICILFLERFYQLFLGFLFGFLCLTQL